LDALNAVTAGVISNQFHLYRRGVEIGQDFTGPIPNDPNPWRHRDVAFATRASSSSARATTSRAAPGATTSGTRRRATAASTGPIPRR
jgi:hypothetical protein